MKNGQLKDRAVLMRLAIGMPGESRKDADITEDVVKEKKMGTGTGKWIKNLYPPHALASIKSLDNAARALHARLTLPFDRGVGILMGKAADEYRKGMEEYKKQRGNSVNTFLNLFDEWRAWAKENHGEAYDEALYDSVKANEKFYFEIVPLPVPDSEHFTQAMHELLGTDADTVNKQVATATQSAQKELLARMQDPLIHMAARLRGHACHCRNCKGERKATKEFKDTLVENIREIAELAPKLCLSDDEGIAGFAKEMLGLCDKNAEELRADERARELRAADAEAMIGKLREYKIPVAEKAPATTRRTEVEAAPKPAKIEESPEAKAERVKAQREKDLALMRERMKARGL